MTSPYASYADTLRDNGYHVMPAMPGSKVPGAFAGSSWAPMSQWSKWCDQMPPDFLHQKWLDWPDAGICVAHGNVVGLDIDTDRKDVAEAAIAAVGASPIRRMGAKGWMGYYRPESALLAAHTARVRWYDKDGTICVELLLHGTQSVVPPTIHPDTGKPYRWLTDESMEDVAADDLPILPGDAVETLDAAFAALGLTRKAPRKVNGGDYKRPAPTAHDLEKPLGRSLNDRAMEPVALDLWWPALELPKSRQRGRAGTWEAVPFWRVSNSGRAIQDRNPNLKATPSGIVDFGADRSYTPIDVVMAARDCSFAAATEWLGQYVRSEDVADMTHIRAPESDRSPTGAGSEPDGLNGSAVVIPDGVEPLNLDRWAPVPVFAGTRSFAPVKPIAVPSEAEFYAMLPKEPPPFPIRSFDHLDGLLGLTAAHIEAASPTQTEAGALAVALPMLGAVMGRAYESPTKLRTNIYAVALGGSGTGKTSLVNPAKELMIMSQLGEVVGMDDFASGTGLINMLTANPRRVSFLDEFGHKLQQIGSAGAGIHAKQIITEMTKLYSSANSRYTGTAYATREPAPIDCPHLCLFGMATPEQFWRAFGSSSLEDGSVARYLVFPLGQTAPKSTDVSGAETVAREMRRLQSVIAGRITGNLGASAVYRVPMTEDAERARAALKDKETAFAQRADESGIRGAPAIIRRITENAIKIALISAVGRNFTEPEIDDRDMAIGHALAWWSANVMISNIASHIADNQIERDVNEMERKIRSAGPNGIQQGKLFDSIRSVRKRDKIEILEGLIEAGIVDKVKFETKTKSGFKIVYRGGDDGRSDM